MRSERLRAVCAAWTPLLGMLLALFGSPSPAQDLRAEEIAQCLPGELRTWGDGVDQAVSERALVLLYQHRDAPPWFSRADVVAALRAAATAWSDCGIALTVRADDEAPAPGASPIRVAWSASGSRGNFGLADRGTRSLWLGPQAFALLRERNPAHDARSTLQMVISHEMGHFLGIMAHSRRCVDVTSYYRDAQGNSCSIRGGGTLVPGVEYRAALPTACDIARCRQINARQP